MKKDEVPQIEDNKNEDTTKVCPKCGNTRLVHISTYNEKRCTSCFDADGLPTRIPWFKEQNEKDYI